jgi:hypothetical protein
MIALVKFTSVLYSKIIHEMQAEISRITASKDKKEDKLNDWQQKMIEQVFGKSEVR